MTKKHSNRKKANYPKFVKFRDRSKQKKDVKQKKNQGLALLLATFTLFGYALLQKEKSGMPKLQKATLSIESKEVTRNTTNTTNTTSTPLTSEANDNSDNKTGWRTYKTLSSKSLIIAGGFLLTCLAITIGTMIFAVCHFVDQRNALCVLE